MEALGLIHTRSLNVPGCVLLGSQLLITHTHTVRRLDKLQRRDLFWPKVVLVQEERIHEVVAFWPSG
jgi:hypothetical protein